jgi:uncharacterized membrane protein YphA (DoxX/SURF4 family)
VHWIALSVQLSVGLLLLAGGTAKILAGRQWRFHWLAAYRSVPLRLTTAAALGYCFLEAGSGALLLVGLVPWLAATVLLLTTLVAITVLIRRQKVECGCFAEVRKQTVTWPLVLRNLCLILGVCVITVAGLPLAVLK